MREIKFRAWFIDGKHKVTPGQKCSMQEDRTFSEFLTDVENCADENGYNFILMQFTGLRDKNGREIYEGDICQCFNFIDRDFRHEVEYSDGAFGYELTEDFVSFQHNINFNWLDGKSEFIEVIGNIYENPELLNKEQG